MSAPGFLDRLRQLDAYPKTLEDFRVKTFAGAVVTIVSGIFMLTLFVSELNFYLSKEVIEGLYVDASRGEKLKINVDIIFPNMPCAYMSVDAMDISGEHQLDVVTNLFKKRLNDKGREVEEATVEQTGLGDRTNETDGEIKEVVKKEVLDADRCESCYGAESDDLKCCNSCEDVREAYRRKGWAFRNSDHIKQCKREGWGEKLDAQKGEGCNIYGYMEVNKVAGNFHFAPGKSFQQHHTHVHDLQPFSGSQFNMSHHINQLSFGMEYPGMENPLDQVKVLDLKGSSMYQYFVKIVPTTYIQLDRSLIRSNQYSVTKHEKKVSTTIPSGDQGLPGVFVLYELSPLMVKFTEQSRSFMHFLTGVCAIVGGIFTVAGLIDSMIYHSSRALQKKMELGKTH